MMSQAKQAKGRFTQGMAGKKRTMLPGGVLVETWINPFGLTPTLMARVKYPTKKRGGITEYLMQMETGWLTKNVISEVYTIYVWDDLAQHFVARTGGVDNVAQESEEEGCFGIISRPPPTLGADNEYETIFDPRTDPVSVYDPHRYSGLARLLMQGKQGANRKFWTDYALLVGTGFSAGSDSLGVIRSPGNHYWLIHASSSGVLAVKLEKDPGLYCFDIIGNDGAADNLQQLIIDAAVLAFTTVATRTEGEDVVADVIELLSEAEIRDVYRNEDDDLMESLGWGWVWKAQDRRHNPYDAGAIICTQLETGRINNWRVHYKVSELSFTFNENGVPSATVSEIEAGKFMPPSASRLGTANTTNTLWRYVPPPSPGPAYWARGVVAAWYTIEGDIKLVEYSGEKYSYSSTGTTPAEWNNLTATMIVCGSGTATENASASVDYTYPVWSISEIMDDTFTITSDTSYTATLTLIGGSSTPFGFTANPSYFQQCDGSQIADYFWTDGRDNPNVGYILDNGTLTYVATTTIVAKSEPNRMIVLGESPGVVWIIENGQSTTTEISGQNCTRGGLITGSGGLMGGASGYVSYTPASANTAPYCTPIFDENIAGNEDLVGSVFVDVIEDMSEEETNLVDDAIAYQTALQPLSDQGLPAFVSYGGLHLTHAKDIPDGLSSVGYTKRGIWIGGA
jgi:hypothetical protein